MLAVGLWIATLSGGGDPASWVTTLNGNKADMDVDFTKNLAYLNGNIVSLPSLIINTRANAKYFYNLSGILSEVDADLVAYGDRGAQIEGAFTNAAFPSEDFSGDDWSRALITPTASAQLGPDGSSAVSLMVEQGFPFEGLHNISQSVTSSANVPIAMTIFVKSGGPGWCYLNDASSVDAEVFFELSGAGAVGTVGAAIDGTFIEALADGWYRVGMLLPGNGAGLVTATFGSATADGVNSYQGDGATGLYFFGAQVVYGISGFTSYIPTVDSAAGSTIDAARFFDRSWYGTGDNTVVIEWVARDIDGAGVFDFETDNPVTLIETTGMSPQLQDAATGNTAAAGTIVKAACRISVNDYGISLNGGTVAEDTSQAAPGNLVGAFYLARNTGGTAPLNGFIRRVSCFRNVAANNTELQALSAL
jgi:hypothetical protein